MEESFVPLNDNIGGRHSFQKSNSFGSNDGIELHGAGEENTLEFRIQAKADDGSKVLSLWHDINLTHIDPTNGEETPYLNFICEIPKFTRYDTMTTHFF
jgi:inorganic pyrophosphatase